MLLALSEPITVGPEAVGKPTDHRRVVVEVMGRILAERDVLPRARSHAMPLPTWSACAAVRPGLFAALATAVPFVLLSAEGRAARTDTAPLQQARLVTLARIGPPTGEVESRSPPPVW